MSALQDAIEYLLLHPDDENDQETRLAYLECKKVVEYASKYAVNRVYQVLNKHTRKEIADNLAEYVDFVRWDSFRDTETRGDRSVDLFAHSERIFNPDTYFDDQGKFQPGLLADHLAENGQLITIRDMGQEIVHLNGGVYCKDDGENGNSFVQAMLQPILGHRLEEVKTHHITELLSQVRLRTYKDYSEFTKEPIALLPIENGILNLETLELLPYDGKHLFLFNLPIRRDPEADCPKFKQFLKEILHEKDIPMIEEMLGYCLWRDYYIKKGFLLVGEGNNGKSLLCSVIDAFLGLDNISTQSLTQLSEGRFSTYWLRDRLANIYPDISDRAVKETGKFKMLTGDDWCDYEIKGGKSGGFLNYAKMIFSCNRIPDAKDDTDAYFDRWEIVDFPWTFVSKPLEQCAPNERPARDKDKYLKELTTDAELSGILNLALVALKRLREAGRFSSNMTTQQTKLKYIRMSNSLKAFLEESCRCSADIEQQITKLEFQQRYHKYCEDNRLAKKTIEQIGKMLPNLNSSIRSVRHRVEKVVTPFWDGIAWLGVELEGPADPDQGKVDDPAFVNQPRSPDEGAP
jgi:putative DNA primase/helicase